MEPKPRSAGNRRRRDRAARMQKRQQRQCAVAEISENDESPPVRQKRPPTRKKRIKEPVFQEDIVDGFAFLCFKTYEDLQRTVTKYDKKVEDGASTEDTSANPRPPNDHPPVLEESLPHQLLDKKPKLRKNNTLPKVKKKGFLKVPNNLKHPSLTNDENSKPGEEILETPRGTSRDQLSDDGSHASLERGYMCDSESGDDRGSEPECDLFSSKITDSNFIAKKNNPGHSHPCRSPPVLPPIHPVQNGTHHPEPSTAVAAVTASASPAPALVVGSTSPREPQIGSPAAPLSAPPSPRIQPAFLSSSKDSASNNNLMSNNNNLLNNGYEFVSDTSPPSPTGKFLSKRAVPSSAAAAVLSKPTINVYDFVSDHSAPSSPDGVIFISSSSKFLHKGVAAPPNNNKDAAGVSNGHQAVEPPILSSPQQQQSASNHKSALDMSLKPTIKTEPPSILPPSSSSGQLQQHHHQQSSPRYTAIPYSSSSLPPVRKMSPLTVQSSPSLQHSAPPSMSPAIQRTSASAASSSQRCRSPAATAASHSNTPTPVPPRDTHSSHSNSSLSSLSQLSTTHKEGGSRSHSNSSQMAPALANAAAYGSAGSLAGLVFSKPQSWSGNSSTTNTISGGAPRQSPAPPRSSPALSAHLPPTLPPAHHSSPFSSGGSSAPPPPLLPAIFPPSSLTPTGGGEGNAAPSASSYRSPAEGMFPQHNEYKKHPDFLRRELDTRFLASQDHSIPIPPPPYMQSDHQMHQQPPFCPPPPLGAPMQQPPSHMYEKYPKLDSSLYRRPSIGLSSYPPVSSLFTPGGGTSASTPFVPPAHLAALQPKINSVSKTKSMKPGKWCAMHVRIAWEIYNHQQKQKQAEAHKAGMALVNNPTDRLHAANHLFCSLPRTHDMSPFSGPLLSAASHPRSYDAASHHSTFLNPTPAHIGPFARPGYPSFAGGAPGFSGLGPLGLPGPPLLGGGGDPWSRGGSLPFGGGSPWGGLKEEAERDRLSQERKREEERQKREHERREKEERERREQERREQERREQERRELERQEQERKEQERKEKERREQERRKEMERREMERREQERREQERQKERDREIRLHHQLQKNSMVLNGDLRDHHLHHSQLQHHHAAAAAHHHAQAVAREWERATRESSAGRSPVVPGGNPVKYEYPPQIKIKQEKRDDMDPVQVVQRRSGEDRIRKREDPVSLVNSSRGQHHPLNHSLDHSRVMGLVPSPAKDHTSPLWGPLTPSPTVSSMDHYRRFDPMVMSQREAANNELSRQISNVMEMERAVAYDRAKLLPPPLRTNESPYATPPTASASSFFSPPVSPYLSQLCGTGRSKAPPPMLNGLPPPLIPCTFPVQNHTGFPGNRTSSPMAPHKLIPGLQDPYFAKERREVNGGHPSDYDAHLRL